MASKKGGTITTTFILNGLAKAANGIRGFTQATSTGMKSASGAAAGLQAGIAGAGSVAQRAASVMRGAFAGVAASLNAIRTTALSVFAVVTGAARRMGSVLHSVFIKAASDTKEWFERVVGSQVGLLTGSGLSLKFAIHPSSVARILSVFRFLGEQFTSIMGRAFSLLNPLSRQGIFGLTRRVLRAATFAAAPSALVGKFAKSGFDQIGETTSAAVSNGVIPAQDFPRVESTFRQFGSSGEGAVEIVNKFDEALQDVRENGLNSKFFAAFDQAGLATDALSGALANGYDAYNAFIGKFAQIPQGFISQDGIARLQAATTAIVGSSKAFLPFQQILARVAQDGSLEKIEANMRRFGTAIGPAQVAAFTRFTAGLGQFKELVRGVAIALATQLGPAIGQYLQGLAALIGDNRETIAGVLRRYLVGVVTFVTEVGIVMAGLENSVRQGAYVFGEAGFEGYDLKHGWLVSVRDFAIAAWDVLKGFFGYLSRFAAPVLTIIGVLFDKLSPTGVAIGNAFQRAGEWVARFVENLAMLALGLEAEPQFSWIQKVANLFAAVGRGIVWVYDRLADLNKGLRGDPRTVAFYTWVKDTLKAAGSFALQLGQNIAAAFQGRALDQGFTWLGPLVDGLGAAWDLLKKVGNAAIDFVGVFVGNADAISRNPGLEAFKRSLVDDVMPRMIALGKNVYAFLVAIAPPIFSTIEGIFKTLSKYVDGIGTTLQSAGKYVVDFAAALGRYFTGKEFAPGDKFAWVKTVLDDVRDLTKTLIDFGAVMSKYFRGEDIDLASQERFKGVLRVVTFFEKLKNAILAVGDALSWLTGGRLSAVQASLAVLFGGFLLSRLGAIVAGVVALVANLGKLAGILATIGIPAIAGLAGASFGSGAGITGALTGGIVAALIAAAGTAAVTAAFKGLFSSAMSKLSGTVVGSAVELAAGALGARAAGAAGGAAAGAAGGAAASAAAGAAAGSVAHAGAGAVAGGLVTSAAGAFSAFIAWAGWPLLLAALVAFLAHLTGLDKVIWDGLKNFLRRRRADRRQRHGARAQRTEEEAVRGRQAEFGDRRRPAPARDPRGQQEAADRLHAHRRRSRRRAGRRPAAPELQPGAEFRPRRDEPERDRGGDRAQVGGAARAESERRRSVAQPRPGRAAPASVRRGRHPRAVRRQAA